MRRGYDHAHACPTHSDTYQSPSPPSDTSSVPRALGRFFGTPATSCEHNTDTMTCSAAAQVKDQGGSCDEPISSPWSH